MNETEFDVQSIEHLEFDVPCGRRDPKGQPKCDLPARWVGITKCCGKDNFLCDLHLRGGTSPTGFVRCLACGVSLVDDRTRYVSVEPL